MVRILPMHLLYINAHTHHTISNRLCINKTTRSSNTNVIITFDN